jgi:hypothetical protein
VHLPALLRPPPTRDDVAAALLAELQPYADGSRQVPNAWTVWLSARDARRRRDDLPRWSSALQEQLVAEQRRSGLPVSGFVTVGFGTDEGLAGGRFRVTSVVDAMPAVVLRDDPALPGRPRLVVPAGGTVQHGTPAAAGVEREVLLTPGSFVIGRDRTADLRLQDPTVSPRHVLLEVPPDGHQVRLRDLGSVNGTRVNGVPTVAFDLVDGNRIDLGEATLVFHRDPLERSSGRQGGEGG